MWSQNEPDSTIITYSKYTSVMAVENSCRMEEAMLHFLTSQIMQKYTMIESSKVYDITQLTSLLVGLHSELKIININMICT